MGMPAWIAALGVLGTWFIFGAAIWGEKSDHRYLNRSYA